MNAGEISAVFASGVAVATSIGSLAVALTALLRGRAHLRVATSFAYLTPSMDGVFQISVINDGGQAEIVSSVGFQTSDGKQVLLIQPENFPNGPLPWRLQANESNMAIIPQDAMRLQRAEGRFGDITYAFARTQSGRFYRDKPPQSVIDFIGGRSA